MKLSRYCVHAQPSTLVLWAGPRDLALLLSTPAADVRPSRDLGVNFMEKTISVRRTSITFSLWDLGGQREFVNMLPLVCNDAVAILFMFDLSRKSTLNSVKEWYRQARGFNKVSVPTTMRVWCALFGASGPVVMLRDICVSAAPPTDLSVYPGVLGMASNTIVLECY